MPKRPTVYHRPESLSQALQLLAQPDTVPLAGGTSLLARQTDNAVVDLQALGLNLVAWPHGQIHIGATVTLSELAEILADRSEDQNPAPLLRKAIRQAGPNTFRNAATIGGVIASRLQDSELLAALLVLESEIVLYGPDRSLIELGEYLAAAEKPAGLITQINIPWTVGIGYSERVARTPADTPIVSVTCWQPVDSPLRLAATGIGSRPGRLTEAEAALADGMSEACITAAGQAAKSVNRHPGDFRGDANYRAEMAAVLTRRVCLLAARSEPR